MKNRINAVCSSLFIVVLTATGAWGQSFRRAGAEFNALRTVNIPSGKSYSIVVTDFFHHGEIRPDGKNVIVTVRGGKPVPMRVLQLGPGDFCRLAFQPAQRKSGYEILYGGDPPKENPPTLTSRDGLLLEIRRYKNCNLHSLDSVHKAFDAAEPIGADYVESVFHSHNPISLKAEPFFSRYSGYLNIDAAGVYGFFTSSRDASFLLIDGKPVISAPGRHGPMRRARRGSRGDVRLSAGQHKFDYYHAAAGPTAMMVAAWEIAPQGEKPRLPRHIPPGAFRTQRVAHLPAGGVTMRTTKLVPDFLTKVVGDVPLPDNDVPMIGVLFRDASPKALTMQGKIRWDFGDGQTDNRLNTDHVYLRPGPYTVKLSIKRGGRTVETTNRIYVDRPAITRRGDDKNKLHTLDEYLKIVETYDPHTLDAVALRQLVLAYEAKALELVSQSKQKDAKAVAEKYFAMAVSAGKVAFLENSAADGDDDLFKLAGLIAPIARERLGDSDSAARVWYGASRRIGAADLKAECETRSADVAVNDLPNNTAAKKLLEAATTHLGGNKEGEAAGRLQRVWGDYYAAVGDGEAAGKAYRKAEKIRRHEQRYVAKTAWGGAHSRSTEEFIRNGRFDRAAAQIHRWLNEFPAARIDGYLTLLYAKYWAGRKKYDQAVAQAEQLQAVNPNSPYVDRILLLSADCDMRRGRTDRALATLHSILQDYPGSPLVPVVKKNIELIKIGARD